MSSINANDVAAWWGAIVATLVLVWEVYKARKFRAPKVRVHATPGMVMHNSPGVSSKKLFISISVVNHDDLPFTILGMWGVHYKTRLHKLFRRQTNGVKFFVVPQAFDMSLPRELDPGAEWVGRIDEYSLVQDFGRRGLLYCGVRVATAKKLVLSRVRFRKSLYLSNP